MAISRKKKLAVTIDIEDWYHIPSVCGSEFSVYKNSDAFFENWRGRYDYLSEPTHKILNLLRKFGIKATFFIVADVTQHYPGLVESIADEGHEIACHGMHHSSKIDSKTKIPLINPDSFERTTKKAKDILEKITGTPVIGYRAPNALVSGWMIDSLERLGFQYDSSVSVNSFYNKTDSSLGGVTSCPYFPQQHGLGLSTEPRGIFEFPFAYFDIGLKIPTSGGPILRFLGEHIVFRGLEQSLERGSTIFYFHPIDIADQKFPAIGNGRPLYWLCKGAIVEKRITHIMEKMITQGVEMGPLREMIVQ